MRYKRIMKISLDIPDKELRDVMKFTRAKTKRQAIVTAIADYNRRQRMAALVRHSGTFTSLMTNEEIEHADAHFDTLAALRPQG